MHLQAFRKKVSTLTFELPTKRSAMAAQLIMYWFLRQREQETARRLQYQTPRLASAHQWALLGLGPVFVRQNDMSLQDRRAIRLFPKFGVTIKVKGQLQQPQAILTSLRSDSCFQA